MESLETLHKKFWEIANRETDVLERAQRDIAAKLKEESSEEAVKDPEFIRASAAEEAAEELARKISYELFGNEFD